MTDEHKLPAEIAARALAPAEQSRSLVARGLEAIRNRQQTLVLFGGETDAQKSFLEGVAAEKRGDYAEAVKWYRKAANQGYVEAQLNLGIMYEEHRAPYEGPQDDPHWHYWGHAFCEAVHWFRLAADQGHAKAQFKLGVQHYDPFEPIREEAGEWEVEATKWLRLAADQGYAEAQYYLGHMYYTGRLVPQDYAEAAKWFRLAADQGYAEAQLKLGIIYQEDRIPDDTGPESNAVAAEYWLRLAAHQGNGDAEYALGVMYLDGTLPQDYAEAVKHFHRAAERGHARAEFNLGVAYAKGQGVEQDYVQAHAWFDLAARSISDTEESDKAVKGRDSLATKMTPVQIAEAQRLVRQRTESHAS
jgi:uncharacterized protein